MQLYKWPASEVLTATNIKKAVVWDINTVESDKY